MSDMLAKALEYASRGWYVFPCREKPGQPYIKNNETITPLEKTPYTAQGLNDASIDPNQIELWWKRFPDALIGVNAGKSGLFVLDIDKKHVNGLDTFSQWNINDSAGLHSFTPSGGIHIVFTGTGKSSTNAKTGIDTRGEGGYFIVPPSKVIEGKYVGEYRAFDDWSRTPGIIPDGLMSRLFPNKTVEYVRGSSTSASGEKKQLSRATLNYLANGAPQGERNSTLFKVMADFAGCGYEKEDTRQTLWPVSERIGLTKSEFEQVLEHTYSKPRTPSIPDSIQEKIQTEGKKVAGKITTEEQEIMESFLLACLMVDNNLIPVINDILNFADFLKVKNRIIYKSINTLYLSGKKADFVTVSNQVQMETDKISLDDIAFMINQYFINTDNATTYAHIIKEKASIRKIEALMDNKEKYIKSGNLVEIINSIEKDISDIAVYGGAKSTNVLSGKQAVDLMAERTRMLLNGEIEQLKIGFEKYDNMIGGLYSNELVILAGRAGDGKSAMALSILNNVSLVQKKPTLLFSLEMSTHECIGRLITQMTGLPFRKVYQGKLTPEEWDEYERASKIISESGLYIDDSFGITVPELRSKIRKMMEKDIQLVVIDQLEQIKGYEGMPAYIKLDNITYDIKNMTKEFNIPILLNHQLNRNITDRKLKNPEPQLSDLNQAGEKPSNQVWVISHKKDEKGTILHSKIKILKNRNGARIEFPVIFVGERMLFSNPAREEESYVFQDHEVEGGDGESDFVPW